ncbi:MAG: hypothetical protein SGJ27_24275 [Candidatus Melainabacteria bacterium]|nr:hypothetical protein [Candidatus Melainabacteria bacterium]
MNSKQKFAFLLGVITIALMGLYPPWKEAGPKGLPMQYAPIFAPPTALDPANGLEIDIVRLFVQVGVAAILTGGLVAAAAPAAPARGQFPNNLNTIPITPPPANWQTQFDPSKLKEEEEEDLEEDNIEVADGPNIIRLPAGKTYGEFLVESDDDPEYWESLSAARGVIKLPPNKRVQLEIKDKKDIDLTFVANLAPSALHSVDLSESGIKDGDLAHLQKLSDLKELDLSSTKISNEALSFLKGLSKLEKLWLDGTQVNDSCLEELQNLKSLKKLSLKDTKITADGIKTLEEKLSSCKVET